MDLEEVQAFVNANKVTINEQNKKGRCVDGRYFGIKDFPMISKPGGDAGDVMIIFGAMNILGKFLSDENVFNIVVTNIAGIDRFNFHTDTHADKNTAGLGCGHLKQAKLDPVAYGITQEQIEFLFNKLLQAMDLGANQEVLDGNHEETAVIVVDSSNYGVMPLLKDNDKIQESFIYQRTLHEGQMDKLAQSIQEAFANEGIIVEESEVKNALDVSFAKQLSETLKRLANGLPVYVASISDTGEVSISQ